MKPYWTHPNGQLWNADVMEFLAAQADESVHCVVTSPPYWGLRSYGFWEMQTLWEGTWADFQPPKRASRRRHWKLRLRWRAALHGIVWSPNGRTFICALGLEPTPELYVEHMVTIMADLRRVLRKDGTLWLNMGDAYHSGNRGGYHKDWERGYKGGPVQLGNQGSLGVGLQPNRLPQKGLKDKDLIGMPWRLAFALQADGWWLRSDICWHKPNPMPESVTDRPTKAHEMVFLMTKAARYFYDADAVREQSVYPDDDRKARAKDGQKRYPSEKVAGIREGSATYSRRNLRDVWTIATEPYKAAHFATFPQKLVEPCIKAGTSERGCCAECGAQWVRVVEVSQEQLSEGGYGSRGDAARPPSERTDMPTDRTRRHSETTGWRPTCDHDAETVPCVVMDMFCGSGTVGLVAGKLGRRWLLNDLSPDYCEMAAKRCAQVAMAL